MQMQIQQVSD